MSLGLALVMLGVAGVQPASASVLPFVPALPASLEVLGVIDGITIYAVADTAAVAAVATVALPAEIVAGGILAVGATVYGSWKLGGVIGTALPCFDCPSGDPNAPFTDWPRGTVAWTLDADPITPNNYGLRRSGVTVTLSPELCAGANGNGVSYKGYLSTADAEALFGPGNGDYAVVSVGGTAYSCTSTFPMYSDTYQGYGRKVARGVVTMTKDGCPILVAFAGMSGPAAGDLSGGAGACAGGVPSGSSPGGVPTGEPLRTRTTADCTPAGGSGATGAVVEGLSDSFVASAASFPPLVFPACPTGTVRSKVGTVVEPITPGSPVAPTPIINPTTVPTTYPTPGAEPCLPGGADYPCPLVPTYNPPDPAPQPVPDPTPTRPWDPITDPHPVPDPGPIGDPSTPPSTDPWGCQWGALVIPAGECDPIWNDPGLPAPNPTDPIDPDPGTGEGCFEGMGVSPLTWPQGLVISPLKCLFIPTAATSATVSSLGADLSGRAPVSWLLDAGGFAGAVLGTGGDSTGCFVYDVHLGALGTFHIINSCDPGEPIVKAIAPIRPILLVASYVAFLGPLAWWAWRSYAPLSRPQG